MINIYFYIKKNLYIYQSNTIFGILNNINYIYIYNLQVTTLIRI